MSGNLLASVASDGLKDVFDFPSFRNLIIEEKSYVPFEDLIYGRMSFQGFNPEVEVCVHFLSRDREFFWMWSGIAGKDHGCSFKVSLVFVLFPPETDDADEPEEQRRGREGDRSDADGRHR